MSERSNPIVIIPARMASTRLPGKPLADIHGQPMIMHVWRRAMEADIGPVVVACAETEIADVVRDAGGEAVLTHPGHLSGSDRIYEALELFDSDGRHDLIVNLQGDLPTIDPATVGAALRPLAKSAVDIATLATPIGDPAELGDPNVVKAVLSIAMGGQMGRAIYFSRLGVPWGDGAYYHHIGIYAYRRAALARFVGLPHGVIERRERLEQLRALENGMRIDAVIVGAIPQGVDTPEDLERARALLAP